MYRSLNCIALRTIRHSDSKNLLSAWSRELGRITIAMPAGPGREARRRRGLTSPLATFEAQADLKPGHDIISVRDLRPLPGSLALDTSPLKNLTAIFLAEFLDLLLRRSQPDDALSDFIFGSLQYLAATADPNTIANFHLIFIYRLTHLAGIEPADADGSAPSVFDMRDARFRTAPPLHPDWLGQADTSLLRDLARTNYDTASALILTRAERRTLLDALIRYYSIHLLPLTSLHTLEILRAL